MIFKLRHPKYHLHGFTLLEMLVVLVLVSLISTLLLQSLSYILQLRSHLQVHLDDLQHGAIQEAWFRSTTAGIITDYYDGKNIFQGTEREFSGLTLNPLEANLGALSPFAWQLQTEGGRTSLRYRKSDGEYWEVASWTGEPGTFRYMDIQGKWHTQWPPPFFSETPPQIPRFILLEAQRRQTAMTWMVQLADRNIARFDNRGKD